MAATPGPSPRHLVDPLHRRTPSDPTFDSPKIHRSKSVTLREPDRGYTGALERVAGPAVLATPPLLRRKTVADPCTSLSRGLSSLSLASDPPAGLDADGFEELTEGDGFFDEYSWLFVLLALTLRYHWHKSSASFLIMWWIIPAMIPEACMLPRDLDPRGDYTAMGHRAVLFTLKTFRWVPHFHHVQITTRLFVILVLTFLGQWVCRLASRRLAILLLRERNARRKIHPRHVHL